VRSFLTAMRGSIKGTTLIGSTLCVLTFAPLAHAQALAPTITTQPVGQSVTVGQPATFTVVATGTAPLTYAWQRSGNAAVIATTATYTLPTTITGDNGATFKVTVTNATGSVTSSAAVLTVTSDTDTSASSNLKNNFGFGVAVGLTVNVVGPNIVNNATVDANGIVRVNTRANTTAGFLLETHYFIWNWPKACTSTCVRGTGPFVAAQPGTSQIISGIGAGWMLGFRRPVGQKPSGFALGVGYEAIPAAQVLGSEFVPGKPAPTGPGGAPLPIRYETQDKGSLLAIFSVTF
jgi:hypothetical protein